MLAPLLRCVETGEPRTVLQWMHCTEMQVSLILCIKLNLAAESPFHIYTHYCGKLKLVRVNSVISGLKYISICNKFQFLILFFRILFRSSQYLYCIYAPHMSYSSYKSNHLILWACSIMCLYIMEIEAQGSCVAQSHS